MTTTVDVDPDIVSQIATAANTLSSDVSAAAKTGQSLLDNKAFGLLCGAIIAPLFNDTEQNASDLLNQAADSCTKLADLYDGVGGSYSDLEQALTTAFGQITEC